MTDDRMALIEALQKADDGNFLRSLAETVLQILMEADVEGMIGAGRYERSGERSTWRNGYRDRTLDTRLGQLNLRIPKLRTGSYFPPFLEARKTTEKALVSVIQEAWIAGVSTRKVDDEAEEDVLAYMTFPSQHRVKLHSTNPLERLNKEVKRRADVVGIFPNEDSIVRLIGAVLLEQNDEWLLQHRYMQIEGMVELDAPAETHQSLIAEADAA
ncbi:transposase [Amaricoccus sp.]|uniref:transposase n=1 Tax=Amaricoccus sp. TaxID=1872485 RepID=UPI0026029E06|nr:transposase [Amaricoccus sp.]HRO13178.1 transposase [Amaricoccus sp.]